MKSIKYLLLAILPFAANAQVERLPLFSRHTISAEFGGLSLYTINYENIVNPTSKFKIAMGGGSSYIQLNKDERCFLTQIKLTGLTGKAPFYGGIGFSFLGDKATYLIPHRNHYDIYDEANIFGVPYIHFRYQPVENGFFTSISAYILKDSDYTRTLDVFTFDIFDSYSKDVAIIPSLSLGYTFNTH